MKDGLFRDAAHTCGDKIYEGIHEMCEEHEIGPDGQETGASCMKSKGHDDPARNSDPRRRAHFDLSCERLWLADADREEHADV